MSRFPLGATFDGGDYQVMERLRGGAEAGQYMAIGPRGACLVTVSSPLTITHQAAFVRLELPFSGVAPLRYIGQLEADAHLDVLAEAMPPGKPTSAGLGTANPVEIAASVARIAARAHAFQRVIGGIRPELIYVEADPPGGVMLAPRGATWLALGGSRNEGPGIVFAQLLLSPEELRAGVATVAGDVFALAATLATWLGSPPFGSGHSPEQLNAILGGHPKLTGLPPSLAELLSAALALDPARRPTMVDFEAALRRA